MHSAVLFQWPIHNIPLFQGSFGSPCKCTTNSTDISACVVLIGVANSWFKLVNELLQSISCLDFKS